MLMLPGALAVLSVGDVRWAALDRDVVRCTGGLTMSERLHPTPMWSDALAKLFDVREAAPDPDAVRCTGEIPFPPHFCFTSAFIFAPIFGPISTLVSAFFFFRCSPRYSPS